MEKVAVTLKEVAAFRLISKRYVDTCGTKQSKLTYAIQKMSKKLDKDYESYNDQIADVRAKYAVVKDGIFQLDDKGEYQTDPTKVQEFTKEVRAINTKAVEVEPFLVDPKDLESLNLELGWYEFFIPFVIADYPEPKEEVIEDVVKGKAEVNQ